MRRGLTVAFGVVLAWLTVSAAPASAGGWAVSTLDEVPSPRAGEAVDVGFAIRQHGVTPVNVDGEVGVELTGPTGRAFFPADQAGAVGHYVARVVFAVDGEFHWAVRQGGFGEQDLGTIEVPGAGGGPAAATSRGYRWPGVVRVGLLVVAGLLASLAITDIAASRRRRRGLAAA
jgi:hypothetical protein